MSVGAKKAGDVVFWKSGMIPERTKEPSPPIPLDPVKTLNEFVHHALDGVQERFKVIGADGVRNMNTAQGQGKKQTDPAAAAGGKSRSDELYKYKTDLKRRFSGIPPRQTHSEGGVVKKRYVVTSQNSGSTSNSPPVSDGSGSDNRYSGSYELATPEKCDSSASPTNSLDLTNSVPGFALHPSGTYYIPIITPASQLMPFLQNYCKQTTVCHPINISVNFGGPFVVHVQGQVRVPPE